MNPPLKVNTRISPTTSPRVRVRAGFESRGVAPRGALRDPSRPRVDKGKSRVLRRLVATTAALGCPLQTTLLRFAGARFATVVCVRAAA